MSEPAPDYASPSRGEPATVVERCRACGGSPAHSRWPGISTMGCIYALRAEIGILQGELLALRLKLAVKPPPLISTYEQLSIATDIPIERLLALGMFAPEPQTAAEAAIADAAIVRREHWYGRVLPNRTNTQPTSESISPPSEQWVQPECLQTPTPETRWVPAEVEMAEAQAPKIEDPAGQEEARNVTSN